MEGWPFVNVTVPVYNEERDLVVSVSELHDFLHRRCRFHFEVVIADNASNDGTPRLALELSRRFRHVRVLRLDVKGRGRALKAAWLSSSADILSYMDIDLSTELSFFPILIESIVSGEFDIATGSRLLKPALTKRSVKREFISRCYNLLVRLLHRAGFSDAQCGFKAISRKSMTELIPLIEDNEWFFDTELLILSEILGHKIFDLPVRWIEDSDSRVHIVETAVKDLQGLMRLKRRPRGAQLTASAGPP